MAGKRSKREEQEEEDFQALAQASAEASDDELEEGESEEEDEEGEEMMDGDDEADLLLSSDDLDERLGLTAATGTSGRVSAERAWGRWGAWRDRGVPEGPLIAVYWPGRHPKHAIVLACNGARMHAYQFLPQPLSTHALHAFRALTNPAGYPRAPSRKMEGQETVRRTGTRHRARRARRARQRRCFHGTSC
jgi:hypothetical protein